MENRHYEKYMASAEDSGSEEGATKPSSSGRVGGTTPRGQESVVPYPIAKPADLTCEQNKKNSDIESNDNNRVNVIMARVAVKGET